METLQELQARAERLDQEVQQLEPRLERLRQERDEARRAIIHFQANRPYMQCGIPLDVLAEIFRVYVKDLKKSPWELSQVCHSWRKLVFDLPTLWSGIYLCTAPRPKRFMHGMQVCSSRNDLQEALGWARSTLLDINCHFLGSTNQDRHMEPSVPIPKSFRRMLELLGGIVLGRWRTISISDSLKGFNWVGFFGQQDARLPNIEYIDLSINCRPFLSLALTTSNSLGRISIPVDSLFQLPTPVLSQHFPSVKQLILTKQVDRPRFDWLRLNDPQKGILGLFPSLVRLDIAVPGLLPDEAIERLSNARHLSALRIEELDSTRSWESILSSLPLRYLCISYRPTHGPFLREVHPGSLQLPQLLSLTIQGMATLPQLIAIEAPRLQQLEISELGVNSPYFGLDKVVRYFTAPEKSTSSRLTPKRLYLSWKNMSMVSTRQLLLCFLSIEYLFLNGQLDSAFFSFFREEIVSLHNEERTVLCPRLKGISIEDPTSDEGDINRGNVTMKAVNEFRDGAGYPQICLRRRSL